MITVMEDKKPTLEEAQKIVGGLVEMVHSPKQPDWQILVNEEGLLRDLPFTIKKPQSYAGRVLSGMLSSSKGMLSGRRNTSVN